MIDLCNPKVIVYRHKSRSFISWSLPPAGTALMTSAFPAWRPVNQLTCFLDHTPVASTWSARSSLWSLSAFSCGYVPWESPFPFSRPLLGMAMICLAASLIPVSSACTQSTSSSPSLPLLHRTWEWAIIGLGGLVHLWSTSVFADGSWYQGLCWSC
jgi:hypothetical protein